MAKILTSEFIPAGSKNPISVSIENNKLILTNNILNHDFDINLLDGVTMSEYVSGIDFKDYKIIISYNTGIKKELLTICNCIEYKFPDDYVENICEGPTYVGNVEWPALEEPKLIDYHAEKVLDENKTLTLVVLSEPSQKFLYKNCLNKIRYHLSDVPSNNYNLKLEVLSGSVELVTDSTVISNLNVFQDRFCSKFTVKKVNGVYPDEVIIKATIVNKANSSDNQSLTKKFYLKNC